MSHIDSDAVMTGHEDAASATTSQNIGRRLGIGSIWLAGGRMIVNLLGILSTFLLARLLTPADFGLVALATALMFVLTAITEMSLVSALVQRQEVNRDHIDTAFTLNLVRALAISLIMTGAAWPLAWLYGDNRLIGIVLSLTGAVLATGFVNPGLVLLTRNLMFRQDFVLNVAEKLVALIMQIGIALYWQSYWALVLGMVAGPVARAMLSYRYAPHRPRLNWSEARELWSFSGWLTGAQVINVLNYRLDVFVVGWVLGTRPLGFYTMGDNLAQMPTREAVAPLTQTLFPGLVKVADQPERLRTAYQRAQAIIAAVAMPAGIGFALVAEPLVLLVMGDKWRSTIPVIQTLSAVFSLQTLGMPVTPLAMATGHTRTLFTRDLLMFVVRVPVVLAGLLLGGLPGLLAARLVAGIIIVVLSLGLVRNILGLSFGQQLLATARSIIAAIAMAVVALLAQEATSAVPLLEKVAISISVCCLTYVSTHAALWIIAGRPEGPERFVLQLLRAASAIFSRPARSNPSRIKG